MQAVAGLELDHHALVHDHVEAQLADRARLVAHLDAVLARDRVAPVAQLVL